MRAALIPMLWDRRGRIADRDRKWQTAQIGMKTCAELLGICGFQESSVA